MEILARIPVGDGQASFADVIQDTSKNSAEQAANLVLSGLKKSNSTNIGMGWTSPAIKNATYDGLWRALVYKARNPEKFMEVTDVKVEDRPGYLKRSKTIKATNQRITEHIYAKEIAGEMIYRMVDQNTQAELDEERVVALKKDPLRLEFFHRHKFDGSRSFWQAPVAIVQKLVKDTIEYATKANQSMTIGMGWSSPEITTATYDGLWRALVYKARNPEKFMDVTGVTVEDCPGYLKRSKTITATNQRVTEHIYAKEAQGEMIYRMVDPSTKAELDEERVVALKKNPLRLEFFHRHAVDGYRSFWQAPVAIVQQLVKDTIDYATKTSQSKTIGMGWSSPEITTATYDGLWKALVYKARNPEKFMDVTNVVVEDRPGYLKRSKTITATGQRVTEHIYTKERKGEIIYRMVDPNTTVELEEERVVALKKDPLRLEFFHRHAVDGYRSFWQAPVAVVQQLVKDTVDYATQTSQSKTIGMGWSSPEITTATYDGLWRALAYKARNPEKFMDVTDVTVEDRPGYLKRSKTIKVTNQRVTEHIYARESEGEMIYRMVDQNTQVELDEERVVAIKKNPLRLEFCHRHKFDGSRTLWQAPVAIVQQLVKDTIDYATKASQSKTIGMGWSSPEITTATYDGLWNALVEKARHPEKFMAVTNVVVEDRPGYLKRTKTITATNQRVTEHIYAKECAGEMIYRMVDQNTKAELEEERVVALKKDPLRLEFFHRHAVDGYRSFWQAPVAVVQQLVKDTVDYATRTSASQTIKFTYFNVEGGGECVRLAFALGGVPYEDDRIDMAKSWRTMKPQTKFTQLPVMTVNGGEQIAQSGGHLRYAGKLGGLIPENPVDMMRVEEVIGLSWDMVTAITPSMQLDRRPQLYGYEGTPQETLTKIAVGLREKLSADDGDIHRFLGYLDGMLAKNGTGWFVGDKPTIAECEVVPRIRSLRKGNRDGFPREIVDKHKNLMKMYYAFHELPAIKAHYKGMPPY